MLEKLKRKLQEWLEIEKPEKPLRDHELRVEIGRVFVEVLNGKCDGSNTWYKTGRNIFNEQLNIEVEKATLKHSAVVARITVEDYIKEEGFIDEIIERIKRKQLN